MKKHIILSLAATMLLASCGNAGVVKPSNSFILGEAAAVGTFGMFATTQLNLYEGNVYRLTQTSITFGYSMILGTTVIQNYGTYEAKGEEDGIASYSLNQAAEVVLSSYSDMGGFNILINTADENQAYPCELPASGEGEKIYAQSKADVIAAYGTGLVVYTEKNTVSPINPNGESLEPTIVTTASGSVSSVLNKKFKKVLTCSDIGSGAVEGGATYNVYHLNVFEDGSYDWLNTTISYGYSMVLGTTVIENFGSGSWGTGEDGYTPFTMNKADDSIVNSYSKMGGFNILINTADSNQAYPAELPASGEGEKIYAQSKDDVIAKYGAEKKIWASDTANKMFLSDPLAE